MGRLKLVQSMDIVNTCTEMLLIFDYMGRPANADGPILCNIRNTGCLIMTEY